MHWPSFVLGLIIGGDIGAMLIAVWWFLDVLEHDRARKPTAPRRSGG